MKAAKRKWGGLGLKILFKQPENDWYCSKNGLEEFGILQCFMKRITSKNDKLNITRKRHFHKGVEVHIIKKGYQIYEIEGESVRLDEDSCLLISPLSHHTVVKEADETEKYSFTFELKSGGMAEKLISDAGAYFQCEIPLASRESIAYIEKEKREDKPYHTVIISNRVLECILQILRQLPSAFAEAPVEECGDMRTKLAKQYIEDNVCYALSVDEIADYCHIGKKQLTRIFLSDEGCTVAEYVHRARCAHIERLLADPRETLAGISEKMHFCSEYYFNTFFKRYAGMTPGAYRRSVLGTQ